ncbi:histidine phosphatase family protein [Arcobacter sp. F2176]|uniref:SixA phosphatase family protein n=1 Tax=Arcobacter sp. F2176 TaxID=2044511 RepID=UPI00100C2018|nr:histidine phosphatase family protein [Arcobacter sp. F2176]RXJ79786.1 phosphoglycerate mutase [Arcobacter sp. F2176]
MKTLYIMRHAHKDLPLENEDDYDIKLSKDGEKEAQIIGEKLKQLGVKLDLITASPSERTKQTAEIISEILEYDKTIMYNGNIYNAFVNELVEMLSYTYDTADNLLLVGHNPALTALGITLGVYREKLKPAEVLKVEFDTNSWLDISKENARFIWIEKP